MASRLCPLYAQSNSNHRHALNKESIVLNNRKFSPRTQIYFTRHSFILRLLSEIKFFKWYDDMWICLFIWIYFIHILYLLIYSITPGRIIFKVWRSVISNILQTSLSLFDFFQNWRFLNDMWIFLFFQLIVFIFSVY